MNSKTREVLGLAALSTLLFGMLIPTASATDQAPDGPDRVATPTVLTDQLKGINEQSSAQGKLISAITLHGGKLYLGYGDYAANTGPIDLYSYDTQSGSSNFELKVPTEAILNFSEINGKLYVPYIDPRTAYTAFNGYASDKDGSWKLYEPIQHMIHNFDMKTTDGKNLFVSGSMQDPADKRNYAAIWYSPDGQSNWQLIRKGTSPSSNSETMDRYYWMAVYGGKLFASADLVDKSLPRKMDVWDNGNWSSSTVPTDATPALDVRSVQDIVTLDDKLISTRVDPKAAQTDRIQNAVYSLSENRRIAPSGTKTDVNNPWDPDNGQYFQRLTKVGDTVYGMTGGGMVYSTKDAVNWTYVMTADGVISPAGFTVDEAQKKIYIAMNPSPFSSIKVPHILTVTIPDPATPENPGGHNSGGFCVKASTEHNGKTFTAAAGGKSCSGLKE